MADTSILTEAARERDDNRARWLRVVRAMGLRQCLRNYPDHVIADACVRAAGTTREHLLSAHRHLIGDEQDQETPTSRLASDVAQAVKDGAHAGPVECPQPKPTRDDLFDEIAGLRAQLTEERIARAREQGETRRTLSLARSAVSQLCEDFAVYRSGTMDGSEERWRGRIERGLEALLHEILGADE